MIGQFKSYENGNKMFSFMEVWNEIVPEPHRSDIKKARQLKLLFKYHSTFLGFGNAGKFDF